MKLIDASSCPGGVVDYLCSTSVYLAPSLSTLSIKLTTLHLASALHRSSQSGPDPTLMVTRLAVITAWITKRVGCNLVELVIDQSGRDAIDRTHFRAVGREASTREMRDCGETTRDAGPLCSICALFLGYCLGSDI